MIHNLIAGLLVGVIYGCGVCSKVKSTKVQIARSVVLTIAIITLAVFYIK